MEIRLTESDKQFLRSIHIEPPETLPDRSALQPGSNRRPWPNIRPDYHKGMPGFGNLKPVSPHELDEIKRIIEDAQATDTPDSPNLA